MVKCLGMQNAFNPPSNQNQQSLTSSQGCNTEGEVNKDGDDDPVLSVIIQQELSYKMLYFCFFLVLLTFVMDFR